MTSRFPAGSTFTGIEVWPNGKVATVWFNGEEVAVVVVEPPMNLSIKN